MRKADFGIRINLFSGNECICGNFKVVYFKNEKEHWITYWGKDGVFEKVVRKEEEVIDCYQGTYDRKAVRPNKLENIPPNIAKNMELIDVVADSLVEQCEEELDPIDRLLRE
ncbi:hypothetical protein HYV79_03635 [Candidatus Woesearchaeota archaeon]|nr:hypothetical protein [Candidatus Woesearchaeota archaeon]